MTFEEFTRKMAEAPPTFQEYWSLLMECGWVAEVPSDQQLELQQQVQEMLNNDAQIVYAALALGNFQDMEWISGSGDYVDVIETLVEFSHDRFRPNNIQDDLNPEAGIATVSFHHGERSFSCTIPLVNDWIQPEVFELVNEALASSGVQQRFMPLPWVGQDVPIVFISPATYHRAVTKGVIPATDPASFESESAAWLSYLRELVPRPEGRLL